MTWGPSGSRPRSGRPEPSGAVIGGQVLLPDHDEPVPATVSWRRGVIDRVEPMAGPAPKSVRDRHPEARQPDDGPVLNAGGALVLPGIVDLHGDAFERCLMPRSGVSIDVDIALADNDAQLLTAGITTSFLSATDSWEPGLRSRETLRALIDGLNRRGGVPDVLLHVRHERCNTDGIDELEGWIHAGVVRLLSYNDHTGDGIGTVSATRLQRAGVADETLRSMQVAAAGRRELGIAQERRLAEAARIAGCITASHDAGGGEDLARDLDLGVAIAEFPRSLELARRYREQGISVLFGAPNLVRGGSHLNHLSVRDALGEQVGTMLCSDYHYPSLLQAPFVAAADVRCPIGRAWSMVSSAPALAGGLTDRGELRVGARADIVVVEPPADRSPARVRHAIVGGHRCRSGT